jgi:Lon protease-like protein
MTHRLNFTVDDETYRRMRVEWKEIMEEQEMDTHEYPFNKYLEETVRSAVKTEEEYKEEEEMVMDAARRAGRNGATARQLYDLATDPDPDPDPDA